MSNGDFISTTQPGSATTRPRNAYDALDELVAVLFDSVEELRVFQYANPTLPPMVDEVLKDLFDAIRDNEY